MLPSRSATTMVGEPDSRKEGGTADLALRIQEIANKEGNIEIVGDRILEGDERRRGDRTREETRRKLVGVDGEKVVPEVGDKRNDVEGT